MHKEDSSSYEEHGYQNNISYIDKIDINNLRLTSVPMQIGTTNPCVEKIFV